jgi:hypothetical protein
MVSGWEKARLRSFRMLPFYVDRHRKPSATSVPNRIPRSAVSGPLRCCSAFQTKNPKRGGKTRLGPEAERKVAIYVPPRLDRTTRGGTTPSRSRINVTGRGRGPESNALLWRIRTVVGLCWDAPQANSRYRRTGLGGPQPPAGAAIARLRCSSRPTGRSSRLLQCAIGLIIKAGACSAVAAAGCCITVVPTTSAHIMRSRRWLK